MASVAEEMQKDTSTCPTLRCPARVSASPSSFYKKIIYERLLIEGTDQRETS
jgi:hypothetical protein